VLVQGDAWPDGLVVVDVDVVDVDVVEVEPGAVVGCVVVDGP
jgi:hypothetical protein